ncbi:hypothetical protein KC640_03600, partial [Candidatus Dojkabacteria bacterium]|nr:hypothetical protein [Candidatus Dojkabacteria bacterium]
TEEPVKPAEFPSTVSDIRQLVNEGKLVRVKDLIQERIRLKNIGKEEVIRFLNIFAEKGLVSLDKGRGLGTVVQDLLVYFVSLLQVGECLFVVTESGSEIPLLRMDNTDTGVLMGEIDESLSATRAITKYQVGNLYANVIMLMRAKAKEFILIVEQEA